jgi:hypothetical protein
MQGICELQKRGTSVLKIACSVVGRQACALGAVVADRGVDVVE